MNHSIKLTLTIFFSVFILSAVTNCQNKSKNNVSQDFAVQLNLVLNSKDVESGLHALERLISTYFPNEMKLKVTKTKGYSDKEEISDGRIKNDLWLASNISSVAWANNNLKNLGAKHKDCKVLGYSPFVLVTTKNIAKQICETDTPQCNWENLLRFLKDESKAPKFEFIRTLLTIDSNKDPLAALSWANNYSFEKASNNTNNDDRLHIIPDLSIKPTLLTFLNPAPVTSFKNALYKIDNSQAEEQLFAIMPERYLKDSNHINIAALNFSENKLLAEQITLCRSTGDWITPEQSSAINKIYENLDNQIITTAMQSAGYRTEFALNIEEALNSTFNLLKEANSSYNTHTPSLSYTFVIDASASMENDGRLYDVQRALRFFVAAQDSATKFSYITFSSTPTLATTPSNSKEDLFKAIDSTEAIGGGAINDALSFAYENTIKLSPNHLQRMILIADGGDLGSKIQGIQIKQMLQRRPEWRSIDLKVIALNSSESGREELKEIAEAANGYFIELTSLDLDSALIELF